MIQESMIFALGFLLASLLSLLALPVVSRRAVRLATRRLSLLVPLSMREIVAERDQIRAENAALVRRMEQRIEHLTARTAEVMAEAGRHAGAQAALVRERDSLAARVATLEADLSFATRTAHEATAELGLHRQVMHDTLGLAERRLAILNTAEARRTAGEALADEQRLVIAGLETRATGQDLRIRGLMSQLAGATADLAAERKASQAAASARDALASDLDAIRRERDEARRQSADAGPGQGEGAPDPGGPAPNFDALRDLLGTLSARTGTSIGPALPDAEGEMARLRTAISAVGAALERDAAAGPSPQRAASVPPST